MSVIVNILRRPFPFLGWIKEFNAATLRIDFVAGLTVALVLIPQSMAYAQLAGLPAYYGLYAAFLPPMIASLFGSSRQLATGPVAVVSLMTAAALEPIATAGSEEYVTYAILLALLVGLFQLLLGILRLGLVVNFLSHPVVNGFTCAAALIIATSQLPKLFGVYVDKAEHHYETVCRVLLAASHYTHWPTVGMAVLAFATMIVLKKVNPRIPNVLVAVIITTVLSVLVGFHWDEQVALDQIESAELHDAVARFNSLVHSREQAEAVRAQSNKLLSAMHFKAKGEAAAVCAQCHADRHISGFVQRMPGEPAPSSEGVAAIHQSAGLIDTYINTLKHEESEVRDALRRFRIERGVTPDGGTRFFVRAQPRGGPRSDRTQWRIKVGTRALDEQQITLIGGGAVVGEIPRGLPAIKLPAAREHFALLLSLIPSAIIISMLGFMEAISIARAMAARTRQKLDPNQELIGQGLANIIGCCGQSYACSGSFSRSAVNLQAGARTGMSNVFSTGVVVVVLLFCTPLLYHLPQAVLAAIIMMAVVGLLNVSGFVHAWRVQKFDGITGIVTFAGTLAFAPHLEWGIFMGVFLALAGYLVRTMRPKVALLSPHSDGSLRDADRHRLRQCQHLAVIRFDGPLNFASVNYLEDEVLGRVAAMPKLKSVLIDGHGISEIDASGEEMLRHLIQQLRRSGYYASFSELKDDVVDALKRAHLLELIGEDHVFPTQAQAVAAAYATAHTGSEEVDCPFRTVMPRVTEVSLHRDGSLRDARRHALPVCEHIAVLRFDDPLSLANPSFLEEEITKLVSNRPQLRHIVFASQGIATIDARGAEKLGQLVERLRSEGYEVAFSGFKDDVQDLLERCGVVQEIGPSYIHPTQLLAIASIYPKAHADSTEEQCPLLPLLPHVTELSLHPDGSLRDAHRHGLGLCRHIADIRFDGLLNFATIGYLEAELLERLKGRSGLRHVLIAAHGINGIDARAADELGILVQRLRQQGYVVSFSGLKDNVLDVLHQVGVDEVIGSSHMYPTQALAIVGIYAEAHADAPEPDCPLLPLLPRVTELSLHPDGSLRDARRHGLALCQRIAAVRFDGPLNFATIGYLEAELLERLKRRPGLRHVLIAAHGINGIDTRAADELGRLVQRLRQREYAVSFSGLEDNVLDVLRRMGVDDEIGSDHMYPTLPLAIAGIHAKAHEDSAETECPLREIVHADSQGQDDQRP